jgi:hypothetical protein
MPHFADADEANAFLDGTKIAFADDTDAEPEATNADRLITGMLFPEFPDHVLSWETSGAPKIVVTVAAMLMASYRYAKDYTEESDLASGYATRLKNDAIEILTGIINGSIRLYDTDYPNENAFGANYFYPNDTTTVQPPEDLSALGLETGDPLRAFSMDQVF